MRCAVLPLLLLIATTATAAAESPARSEPTPATTAPAATDPPIRQRDGLLVDRRGRGLYFYVGDRTPGVSRCNSLCARLWPPLYADLAATPSGPFTLAVREDGRRQWAWRGRPLYRWSSDRKRGEAGGDGVADTWKLARIGDDPAATSVLHIVPPPAKRPASALPGSAP
jgi:predicted lipoprotein with Yx(FWY)xxD motif